MNYGNIKYCDIADGTGIRTSLFVSGCRHHCRGCFQPETWDFDYGKPFTDEVEDEIIESLRPQYVEGLTVLGGEPMDPDNQPAVLHLLKRVRSLCPDKNIWVYTGYTYETDLLAKTGKAHLPCTDELLSLIDVLVDGEFVLEKKDITLEFRGSSNQRILKLKDMTGVMRS